MVILQRSAGRDAVQEASGLTCPEDDDFRENSAALSAVPVFTNLRFSPAISRNFQLELRVFMILGSGCFKHFFRVCSAQVCVSFLTFSFSCLFQFMGKDKTSCDVSESM